VDKSKKIISLILLYVLVLSLLPVELLGHTVEAASVNLRKINLDNPYYVMDAVQYKDKTFIFGFGVEGENQFDWGKRELIVKEGDRLETIIPSSEIGNNCFSMLGETANELYFESINGELYCDSVPSRILCNVR
jgi:hypothetical protein